ncbi:MAG TPA: sialidase family protein, partial [Rugosimonospora sp.]
MTGHDRYGTSVPYLSGTEGYGTFRIPAIVATGSGALLAFAEGRRTGPADSGDIDTVVKRSTDGGDTWGPLRVVAAGAGDTVGNPTPVVAATGRVVLLTTGNAGTVTEAQILRGQATAEQTRRVYVRYGDGDGTAWTAPHEITADVKPAGWRWYATGPGHAIRLAHGPHAGRLVAAANHSTAPAS